MSRHRTGAVVALLALLCVAASSTLGCGGDTTAPNAPSSPTASASPTASTGPSTPASPTSTTWTPAPKLAATASAFKWARSTRLRGRLQAKTWTYTRSFGLPGGPALVVGVLTVPGSRMPRFTARLMPDQHPAGFAGYLASGRVVSPPSFATHLPSMGFDMGALIDWFPYALPAGRYRLMIRRVGAAPARGTYDVSIAGVSSS